MLFGANVYEGLFLDERKKANGLHCRQSIFGWVVTGVLSQVRAYQCQLQLTMLQWTWSLLASGKMTRFLEWGRCLKKIVNRWSITIQRRMLMMAATLFVFLSSLKDVFRTIFKQPSSNCRCFAKQQKFKDHDNVKQQYRDFVKEFVDMAHFDRAPQTSGLCYHFQNHCAFKDSMKTKFRVGFNASSESPNANSLNDCLLLGPRLQDDVFDILIRFRRDYIALSADVVKMSRQVALEEADWDSHRILWRDYITDKIENCANRFSMSCGLTNYLMELIHWRKHACFKTIWMKPSTRTVSHYSSVAATNPNWSLVFRKTFKKLAKPTNLTTKPTKSNPVDWRGNL